MPEVVFQLFLNHIEDIGSTWLEGCRGRAETCRDRCSNVKKQQINRGRFVSRMPTLEDKAMVLLLERKDFIKQNQVNKVTLIILDKSYIQCVHPIAEFIFQTRGET